jgi:hypothetical protein
VRHSFSVLPKNMNDLDQAQEGYRKRRSPENKRMSDDIGDDELVSRTKAAKLFFRGELTKSALRTEARCRSVRIPVRYSHRYRQRPQAEPGQ